MKTFGKVSWDWGVEKYQTGNVHLFIAIEAYSCRVYVDDFRKRLEESISSVLCGRN